MRKFIFLLVLLFPTLAFGQSYEGKYRAVFFNLFSTTNITIAEFEVKADNSLNGTIKIDALFMPFSCTIDKKGKFEAIIEQFGNSTYKLKGKFDKDNKISLVQRNQVGSGLNKSVSENTLEGTFSKVKENPTAKVENTNSSPKIELVDTGKSWLKMQFSNPLFGNDWSDFATEITFSSSVKMTSASQDSADYFNLVLKSKIEGQQRLSIASANYSTTQKLWTAKDLRYISYREELETNRNSFMAGATMQTDPFYTDGTLEIVKETQTQIVFKLSNFRIKRFAKQDFVVLNGFIYADKVK
jgi:hypothetical protein